MFQQEHPIISEGQLKDENNKKWDITVKKKFNS